MTVVNRLLRLSWVTGGRRHSILIMPRLSLLARTLITSALRRLGYVPMRQARDSTEAGRVTFSMPRDLTFPHTRITFRTREDSAAAWDLVANNQPTVGLPNRGMVASVEQLRALAAAGIPVYLLSQNGEQRYDQPLDIERHIATIREYQQTAAQRARTSIQPEAVRLGRS